MHSLNDTDWEQQLFREVAACRCNIRAWLQAVPPSCTETLDVNTSSTRLQTIYKNAQKLMGTSLRVWEKDLHGWAELKHKVETFSGKEKRDKLAQQAPDCGTSGSVDGDSQQHEPKSALAETPAPTPRVSEPASSAERPSAPAWQVGDQVLLGGKLKSLVGCSAEVVTVLAKHLKVKVLDGTCAGEIRKMHQESIRGPAKAPAKAPEEKCELLANTKTHDPSEPPAKKQKQATVPEMWADAATLYGDLEGLPE
jgi:hypothetical protein